MSEQISSESEYIAGCKKTATVFFYFFTRQVKLYVIFVCSILIPQVQHSPTCVWPQSAGNFYLTCE